MESFSRDVRYENREKAVTSRLDQVEYDFRYTLTTGMRLLMCRGCLHMTMQIGAAAGLV